MESAKQMSKIIPVFRMFDEQKAKEFYIDFLGFTLDWEHRFEEDLPLYMQVSLEGIQLQLTEHYGDASPGASIRIEAHHIEELQERLLSKKYKFARPGLETTPWNTKEVRLGDPFGNRLIFYQNIE